MKENAIDQKIAVREATKDDIPLMMDLIRELARYEKAPDEVTVTEDIFMEAGFGPNPVCWSFIAEADGNIVGFALYHIRYSTWKGPMMYLEDIIITAEWRGLGIGKLLFDQLIIAAKAKGLKGMCWQVLDWNEVAIHFYKRYKGVKFDDSWTNCVLQF